MEITSKSYLSPQAIRLGVMLYILRNKMVLERKSMAAGIRIDINMSHYAGMIKKDPECLNRLCDLLHEAVETAIYEHAKREIGPDCCAIAYQSIVESGIFNGLGPAWSPEQGGAPNIFCCYDANIDYPLGPIKAYDDGAKHIIINANWS